jgi:hypothetical protein
MSLDFLFVQPQCLQGVPPLRETVERIPAGLQLFHVFRKLVEIFNKDGDSEDTNKTNA